MQGSGESSPSLTVDAEYLHSLLRFSSDLVSVVDADGTLRYASPSHESMLGYAPTQLVGQNMLSFVHHQDLQQITASLALALNEPGSIASATFRFRHRDGSWRWLESTGRNLIDNPRIAGIVANSRDVTQRVHAEEKLRESELRFKAQFKGLPIPVYTWQHVEDDFVLVDYNHAAEEITKGNVVRLLGERASGLYRDTPDILEEMRQCFAEQRSFRRQMLYQLRSTGETKHMSVSYGYVPPDIVLVHTEDVTKRVRAEEELRELYSELELRVQQRTADLERAYATLKAEATRREQAQKEIERIHKRESVLNSLLRISMEERSLARQLERALGEILSIPWLPIRPQGAIFLIGEEPEVLEMQVSRGLGPVLRTACARVDVGRCLCGMAAASGELQFATGVDPRHEIQYDGMEPHGHYCVPILSGHKTIGVLLLYLDEGHQEDPEERSFLEAVVHTLAGIIERKRGEEALRDSERRYRLLAENATDMISRHSRQGIYLYASPVCHSLLGYTPEELVGHDAYEFFHPDDLATVLKSHSTILEGPTVYTAVYRIRRRDGNYLWVETTSKTIRDPETDQVEEIVAITRDITQRRQAEEAVQASEQRLRELYAQLEEHNRTLEQKVAARTHEIQQRRQVAESLRGMLTVLNSELPLDEVLDHIVLEARRLLGSDTSAIYQLQIPGNTLVARTVHGSPEIAIANLGSLPTLSQALRNGEPVTVPDVTKLPTNSASTADPECACTNCGALLAVPLIIKGEVYGSLALYYSDPRDIADEEVQLAVAFADQAALAIENARLRERVTEAAVLEERARLARELHDSVTQALFSMTLLAEAGQRLAATGDQERVQAYLSRLGETSQQSLKEMRLLVFELRPLALERAGLPGALQQRLDAVEARAGVEARLLVEGTVQVPAEVEEHLYRIAEQALNNALKHAAATSVTVWIHCTETRMALEVVDNGCGFDPKDIEDKGGQGLVSMQERASQINGDLTVVSTPGQGTTVKVEVEIPGNSRNRGNGRR